MAAIVTKLIFDNDNEIRYGQDFSRYKGIPAGEYAATKSGDRWKLVAPGYGETGNYGNGALLVSAGDAPRLIQDYSASHVAYCKCGCGGLVFASVRGSDPDDVEELRQDGYDIEVVSSKQVRETPFGCCMQGRLVFG